MTESDESDRLAATEEEDAAGSPVREKKNEGGDDDSADKVDGDGEKAPPSSSSSNKKRRRHRGHKVGRRRRRVPITYRWVGPGKAEVDGSVVHDRLELSVGGKAGVISVGDCTLLCSGDVEEDEFYGGKEKEDGGGSSSSSDGDDDADGGSKRDGRKGRAGGGGRDGRSGDDDDDDDLDLYGPRGGNEEEEETWYGGGRTVAVRTAIDGGKVVELDDDVPLNRLDPFVARVEKMWEEPRPEGGNDAAAAAKKRRKKGRGSGRDTTTDDDDDDDNDPSEKLVDWDERRGRMKIKARWFFKREDIEALGGNFVGVPSKSAFLSSMSPRDLVLGDQVDENEISTILGKCRVVRRRPHPSPTAFSGSGGDGDDGPPAAAAADEDVPLGAFVCQYGLSIQKPARSGLAGTVTLSPYDGEDEGRGENEAAAEAETSAAASVSRRSSGVTTTDDEPPAKRRRIDEAGTAAEAGKAHGGTAAGEDAGMEDTPSSSGPSSSGLTTSGASSSKGDADGRGGGSGGNGAETGTSSASSDDESAAEAGAGEEGGDVDDEGSLGSSGEGGSKSPLPPPPPETPSAAAKRAPTSEGSTTQGKIQIGPEHQAVITSLEEGEYAHTRNPDLVWSASGAASSFSGGDGAGEDIDVDVDTYLREAASILKAHMKENGYRFMTGSAYDVFEKDDEDNDGGMNVNPSPAGSGDRSPRLIFRECNLDALLATLNEQKYDVSAALRAVSESPRSHLALWTGREKELFDAGFRRYCGSLRMISKGVGPTKTFKEVVDYHYRFKIPDQFRKFQDKKREQARRMMEAVESRRMRDALEESGEGGPEAAGRYGISASAGAPPPGASNTKKTRNLSKTGGGGPDEIGAVERRRVMAKDFLVHVRDTIGLENYLQIVSHLKSFKARSLSIPHLKDSAADLLKDHPELLEQFLEFLPRKFRGN